MSCKISTPFTVILNDDTRYDISLGSDLTLTAGSIHTVTPRLHENQDTKGIDLSTLTGTKEIKDGGTYFVYGTNKDNGYGIKVTDGNPKIYLANANIAVESENAISITGGSPTIHVQGNSTVTSGDGAGIYVAEGSTVTIEGDGSDNVLTATGGNGGTGIGGYLRNDNTFAACGGISIANITLYAHGSGHSSYIYCSPGIGGAGNTTCGTIAIDNAEVHAYGYNNSEPVSGSAAIGTGVNSKGDTGSIPTIQITSSTIWAHRGAYSDYIGQGGNLYNVRNGLQSGTNGYCKSSTVYCCPIDSNKPEKIESHDENGTKL